MLILWCFTYAGGVLASEAVVSLANGAIRFPVLGNIKHIALDGNINGQVGIRAVVLLQLGLGDGGVFGLSTINKRGELQ